MIPAKEIDGELWIRAADHHQASKEALAQPEQEPVTYGVDWGKAGDIPCVSITKRLPNDVIELVAVEYAPYSYTTPPQRKPLTDEEMKKIWYAMQNIMGWYSFQEIARAIEAAHGIKENT